jgi:ubiquinone/menaquinone biosynthesis C-methylase UbiE
VVAEAGIGTGRVTETYIDLAREVRGYDRSAHMIERAARNLRQWSDRLHLSVAEHRELPLGDRSADVFVEGWAFGHVAVDHADDLARVTRELIAETMRVTRRGGSIVLIETLGTNVDAPAPPLSELGQFYEQLERVHGFARSVIRTDYRFSSAEEAIRLCAFFFGEEMERAVRARLSPDARFASDGEGRQGRTDPSGSVIVPEFTGMWIRASR